MATVTAPLPAAQPVQPGPDLELDQRGASKSVVASQWQLMYWRFTRHKLAVVSTFVVAGFYLAALFCEFLAPMDPNKISNTYRYVPPQGITFFNEKGQFSLRPGVHGLKSTRNPETLRITYQVDKTRWTPISFFVKGDPYKLWGLIKMDIHLIGLSKEYAAASLAAMPTPVPSTTAPAPTTVTGGTGATGIGSIGGFGGPSVAPTAAPSSGSSAPGTSTGIGSIGGFSSQSAPTVAPTAVRTPAPQPTTAATGATGTTGAVGATGVTASTLGGISSTVDAPFYLMGTDRLGRDMLSRLLYGTRISLTIGLVGVAISLILGIIFGGISGYYGGAVDNAIQRVIEFIRSLPTIPLWLALAAAMPSKWPPEAVYFAITVILSIFGWTGLARVVRGRFLALREEDFILAARFTNCSERRIIFRHMVPAFTSHLIASITLALPSMVIAETSLSFLGLGLRPPVISWGVLLQEAQNIQTVSLFPWLMAACLPVVVISLAFNFMGDGLRDAADPYAR
ncbi:MAG TPA: ABC transporter permease [Chloroflexota bacterium]|nr:ABC transporter permease [Chloroflexota bacterium]